MNPEFTVKVAAVLIVKLRENAFALIIGLKVVPEEIETQSVSVGTPIGFQLEAFDQSVEILPFHALPILTVKVIGGL